MSIENLSKLFQMADGLMEQASQLKALIQQSRQAAELTQDQEVANIRAQLEKEKNEVIALETDQSFLTQLSCFISQLITDSG